MEGEDLPMPKVDVAYSATAPFVKHYPEEVAQQSENFAKPTWQVRTEPTVEVPKAGKSCFVAPDQDPVFDYLHGAETPKMFFGAIFFAALAYFVFRGAQWHLQAQ